MAHQAGKCICGRTRHWPHNAKIGDTWTCRGCGTVTTLVAEGTPGARSTITAPSWGDNKKRATARNRTSGRTKQAASQPRKVPNRARPQSKRSSSGTGFGLALGLAGLAALAALSKK